LSDKTLAEIFHLEEWERIEREELLNDSDRICQAIRAFAKSWPRKFEQDDKWMFAPKAARIRRESCANMTTSPRRKPPAGLRLIRLGKTRRLSRWWRGSFRGYARKTVPTRRRN